MDYVSMYVEFEQRSAVIKKCRLLWLVGSVQVCVFTLMSIVITFRNFVRVFCGYLIYFINRKSFHAFMAAEMFVSSFGGFHIVVSTLVFCIFPAILASVVRKYSLSHAWRLPVDLWMSNGTICAEKSSILCYWVHLSQISIQ